MFIIMQLDVKQGNYSERTLLIKYQQAPSSSFTAFFIFILFYFISDSLYKLYSIL